MPNTQSAVNHHEYRSVPVTALIESASNPRKRFDDKSLEELAKDGGLTGSEARFLLKLKGCLGRMTDSDRALLLDFAKKLASR